MLKIIASISLVIVVVFGTTIAVEYYEPNERTAAQEANNQSEIKTVEILSSERVAYYTKVLSIFTGVLSAFGLLQIVFLIRADQNARISAEAAIGVEIARVLISNLEFQWFGGANLAGNLQFPKEAISVKNYGRTPAFVSKQSSEMLIARELPKAPEYPNDRDMIGCVIEGKVSYEMPTARLREALPLETISDIINGKTFVWIYGYLSYRDFLNKPHSLKFCARLHADGEGYSGTARVVEGGPEKYTESY